jgi:hypothetical protein
MQVAPRTRPVRCGFAVEFSDETEVHGAALGMPYAGALLNVFRESSCLLGDDPPNAHLVHGFESRRVEVIAMCSNPSPVLERLLDLV